MKEIILFGTGNTAQVLYYHLEKAGRKVAAFTVDNNYLDANKLLNRPVVPYNNITSLYPPERYDMMIAIGYAKMNRVRAEKFREITKMGYDTVSYVSPTAIVWDGFSLNPHCKIGEQTIVQPFSKIGKNVFIGSGCIIGHHAEIKDHSFLASGVIVGGGATVEPYSFLGTGSVTRNDIIIRESSVVGAGTVILNHTQKNSVHLNRSAEKMDISSKELFDS